MCSRYFATFKIIASWLAKIKDFPFNWTSFRQFMVIMQQCKYYAKHCKVRDRVIFRSSHSEAKCFMAVSVRGVNVGSSQHLTHWARNQVWRGTGASHPEAKGDNWLRPTGCGCSSRIARADLGSDVKKCYGWTQKHNLAPPLPKMQSTDSAKM